MFAQWVSRCLPGLSIIALLFLLLLSSPDVVFAPWRSSPRDKAPESHPVMNLAQKIFIVYTILVHLNTLLFTGRLSWALVHVLDQTSKVMKRRTDQYMSASEPSSPVAEVSTALDMKDAKRAATRLWVAEVAETVGEVTHAIILPNYKEDVDTLRCTLDVLASHPRARTQYEVYLAMEQKETSAADKAEGLVSSYGKSFALIQATFHPADVPSEIAGKSSNVAFAARHIGQVHQAELESGTCNVVITVMDADTNLWQDYFTEICRMHYMHPTTANRTLYSCPIIFDRNSNDSPVFVRCADLLWSFAGLSTMYPRSTVSIPTSVYSLPLALATNVGGWDSDPTSIGEDMHMMLKCYFRTNGNLVSRVIHAPASQCNVSSDLPRPGFRRTLDTCVARYRQALRHMWGALDSGFAARNTIREARLSWRSFLLKPRHLALMHLLWEAHFLPCHFTILLLFSIAYEQIAPSLNPWMIFTFQVTGLVRFLSFVAMNVNISLYNRWYKVCLQTRRNDAAQIPHGLDAGGFSDRSAWYSLPFLLERIAFPIAGTVFGAIPTVHAVFMHFATEKLAYRVSKKPAFGVASVV
ncbi:glycosyltransferase family 2 protein [Aspergillus undulatus]|uniref:glycosyltransferase family 2 protein n=1 Tax=Aspergillus undulatus TaxID=1810928 RepID=UPI003CCE2B2F